MKTEPAYGAAIAIGREIIRPTTGIIAEVLAPKLKKIRAWAEERDLKGRITGEQIERAFESYLRRLLSRTSIVKTLVFPEQSFPLASIYEPLRLQSLSERKSIRLRKSGPVASNKRIDITESEITLPGRRTFIIDDAGMGKSTFARHLALAEITQRDRIPIFFELRRMQADNSLVEAIISDFDQIRKEFDRQVLLQLLEEGRFLVILDGLDEVVPELQEKVCGEIEAFSARVAKCAIVVTSRPETPLPRLSNAFTYSFLSLTETQAKSLVSRYDDVASIDVGKRLICQLDKLPKYFLEKPILVSLLYRSFGYNGEISPSITSFYDELYAALYKGHDLTKGGFARKKLSGLDLDGFRRLTRAFAFYLNIRPPNGVLIESSAIEYIRQAETIANVKPKDPGAFLDDLLLAVPLMVRDGQEIRFSHKTIGEFFSAEFVAYSPNGVKFVSAISDGGGERYYEVLRFVKGLNPDLFRRTIVRKAAEKYMEMAESYPSEIIRTFMLITSESGFTHVKMNKFLEHNDSQEEIGIIAYAGKNLEIVFRLNTIPFLDLLLDEIFEEFEIPQEGEKSYSFEEFKIGNPGEFIDFRDARTRDSKFEDNLKKICPALINVIIRNKAKGDDFVGKYKLMTEKKVLSFLEQIKREDNILENVSNIFGKS